MKLPDTQARINAELHRRNDAGLSVRIVHVDGLVMCDASGPFLRLTFRLADGNTFDFDCDECAPMLERARVN